MAAKKPTKKKAPAKKAEKLSKKEQRQRAKGPGVIASIVEYLQAATATKPITKDKMCARLAKRFPERSPDAMMKTINCQVPTRIVNEKQIKVKKNENGYYVQ